MKLDKLQKALVRKAIKESSTLTIDQEKKFYMQIDKALAMRKAGIRGIKSI